MTHEPRGAWLAAFRLHALTLAPTQAAISLSVSGVRDEEKENRARSQLSVRAKGMKGETPVKKTRSRNSGGGLNLTAGGKNYLKTQGWNLFFKEAKEKPWVEFFQANLLGLKKEAN